MINKKLLFPLILILFAHVGFSQTIETKTESDISAETKKQAVEFLREAAGEIGNLRTLENRISFSSELAGLMWFQDEREARTMMNAVIGDFKQLVTQYDSQLNALGVEPENNERIYGGLLGGGDQSDRAKLMRKLMKAVSVRQQIASSIAEHDPQLAYDFFDSSMQLISNAKLRAQFEGQDTYFLTRLLKQIAEKDAGKASEFGRKSLAKGVNYEHIELLKKIYEKDADKGAEFAEDIAKKLKETKTERDDYYMLGSFVSLGASNFEKAKKDKKKTMFTEQMMRDLTDNLGEAILKSEELRGTEYLDEIEKFAPSRAVQIRARINRQAANSASNRSTYAANAVGVAANSAVMAANRVAPPIPGEAGNPGQTEVSSQERLAKDLMSLQNKELPKEEREKVVAQARKIITELPDKIAKITALSGLAAQVFKAGDKELAAQIMADAQSLVNTQPKNYQDYLEVWILASGYAEGDTEKAFPLLEDTIFRLNTTLAAFIKVAEFIDVSGEIVEDGEVQVGSFGGSMVRDLTGGLGMANGTLRNLAKTDFAKTRAITNRFEQPELRILAKMLVLRAVLGEEKKVENMDY
jgi:hypothetical protein